MSNFNVLTFGQFFDPELFDFSLDITNEFLGELTSKHLKKIKIYVIEDYNYAKISDKKLKAVSKPTCYERIDLDDQKKIVEIYSRASILLFPYQKPKESILIESLENGVPILTYDLPEYGNLLHMSYSLLVKKGIVTEEISTFKSLLRILYFDPEARQIMRRHAREKGQGIQKGNLFSSGSN